MECNWELFELRLLVYTATASFTGHKFVGTGLQFFDVTVDTRGIGDFEGLNDLCDFMPVFQQLARRHQITCSFPLQPRGARGTILPLNYFEILEKASHADRLPQVFPGATLYAHKRNRTDAQSQNIGPGVNLNSVQVLSAAVVNRTALVTFFGGTGTTWGF